MAATQDIVATYRGPGKVIRRLLDRGVPEASVLIYLMVACLLVFVAQTPRLAREAYETGEDLSMMMAGTLMAWIFIAPLLLYLVAALSGLVLRLFGVKLTGHNARLVLFWAFLAATPLLLLWGLTAGFIGPGIEMTLVGGLWLGAFVWFWISGIIAARSRASS